MQNASAFMHQAKHVKIRYLCTFVDKEILNAIGYRNFNQERTLLAVVLDYVNERLHPTMIKQLNVLKTQIEEEQETCDFLVNVCQDFFDSDMKDNT